MHPQRTTVAGLGLALLSSVAFATSGTFARSLLDAGWSAEAAVIARVGSAALLLALPASWSLRGRWHLVRRNLGTIGLFGLLAVAAAQGCFFNAVRYLPVGVALLLEYLGVILVISWMWAVHGQRPRRLAVAGSVAAVLGLALVLNLVGGASLDPLGVLWGLGAATGLAGYFVLSARSGTGLPPVVLASGGMAAGTAILLALGLVGILPLTATFGEVTFAGHRTSWLVPTVGLSLVAAIVAYVAGIGAARTLGARLASFIGLTEVMFAVLLAWLLLSELPTLIQLAGGLFIVGGVALVRLDELGAAKATGSLPRPPRTARGDEPDRVPDALIIKS
jgi:drug/metabolite transporter (DMT)-like permease